MKTNLFTLYPLEYVHYALWIVFLNQFIETNSTKDPVCGKEFDFSVRPRLWIPGNSVVNDVQFLHFIRPRYIVRRQRYLLCVPWYALFDSHCRWLALWIIKDDSFSYFTFNTDEKVKCHLHFGWSGISTKCSDLGELFCTAIKNKACSVFEVFIFVWVSGCAFKWLWKLPSRTCDSTGYFLTNTMLRKLSKCSLPSYE